MNTQSSWMPEPPKSLSADFYRSHARFEDVDTGMWTFLCDLIPDGPQPYGDRTAKMLKSISPELRRYYLTRGFDWERGSGGLESCLMRGPENDYLFLNDTIKAYESLGAHKHAAIIRELIPISQKRWKQIHEADASGQEFNYDDGLWDPYEERWDEASKEFDFYEIIWKDIRAHPERYTHTR